MFHKLEIDSRTDPSTQKHDGSICGPVLNNIRGGLWKYTESSIRMTTVRMNLKSIRTHPPSEPRCYHGYNRAFTRLVLIHYTSTTLPSWQCHIRENIARD